MFLFIRLNYGLVSKATLFAALSVLIIDPSGFAAMTPRGGSAASQGPQNQGAAAYHAGASELKRADALEAAAVEETDARKRDKALRGAQAAYQSARGKFAEATRATPSAPESWNALGYTQRKLGDYDAALAAYDRALALRPGFPEALEYRGEAYLGLNRVADVKQVYLDLFAANRTLAAQLMQAIKTWIDLRRRSGGPPDGATIEELDNWAHERAQIAEQTVSLTRAGVAASWR
jgi:tetratricopeptide (TPR) repeat protein